jgi:hypothetical protein
MQNGISIYTPQADYLAFDTLGEALADLDFILRARVVTLARKLFKNTGLTPYSSA